MALTQKERDARKAKRRQAKAKARLKDLSDFLSLFSKRHQISTTQNLISLCRQATNKLAEESNSPINKSTKKASTCCIMNYTKVKPEVWNMLHASLISKVQEGGRCLIVPNPKETETNKFNSSKERHSTSLKFLIGKKWVEGGGDDRTTIMSTHIVLCKDGQFPTSSTDQASHLCHNRKCLTKEHIRWEPSWLNQMRELCREAGVCTGHDGAPDCIFH